MPFVNEQAEDGTWQTIDHDKNIIFEVSGPDKEGEYCGKMIYEGYTVKFDATSGMKIHGEPELGKKRQYDMNWQIFRLCLPNAVKNKQSDIQICIEEALKVWGWNFETEKAHSVKVNFVSGMFIF